VDGSDEGTGPQEGKKKRLQKTGGQTPAFLCSSTRASFCSSRSSVNDICRRVLPHALSPGGEVCALECAVFLERRVAVDGRCGRRVHLTEGKSQDMGLAGADGGDVSSDGAQTLGRICRRQTSSSPLLYPLKMLRPLPACEAVPLVAVRCYSRHWTVLV